VFGIDGLQALHLAMKCAAAVLESKTEQDRLQSIVDREALKFWKDVERAHNTKAARRKAAKNRRLR